jgi:hypothetical protein
MGKQMAKHFLIFIHGIGEKVSEGSEILGYPKLWNNLSKAFYKENKFRFNEKYVPLYTDWHTHQLQWAEEAIFTKSFPDLAERKLSLLNPLRNFTTFFLGDVVAYLSEDTNFIRRTVWQQIWTVLEKPLKQGTTTYSIVAHSLGSVIAYDYLCCLFHPEQPRLFVPQLPVESSIVPAISTEDWELNEAELGLLQKQFRHFFTLGSPIGLFILRKGSLWENGSPFQEIYNPVRGNDRLWINFYDRDDIIAYPVKALFSANPKNQDCLLKDIAINTGFTPLDAHTNYWQNRDVAEKIMRFLSSAD